MRKQGAAFLDSLAQSNPFDITDAGNAQRFKAQHGDSVRYVPEWNWMVFDGKRWCRSELKVRQLAIQTARSIHAEAAQEMDANRQKALSAWAISSQSAPRLQSLLWCAQADLAASTADFDTNPWLLPLANGTL